LLARTLRAVGAEPQISVVVPSRNRAHLLPRLVTAIAAQQGVDRIELIVVDDGSTDDTAAVLADLRLPGPSRLRVVRASGPHGAAAARNVGWRAATAPIIAFTDDDCRPEPDWLAGLLAGFDRADVVQGVTAFDAAEARGRGPFSQVVSVSAWTGQFETSNVAYRRSLLDDLGGFDERFRGASFGEDVDLGWRAVELGARTAFIASAVVVHDVKRGPALDELGASLRAGLRWRHIGKVLRDHPGYRPHRLHRGPFLAATHPPTLVALAGLVVLAVAPSRRRGAARLLALAAVVPWVRHRIVVEPRPGRWRTLPVVLPAAFAVDVVETATVTASGIRYRTLVL
jgi:glycosyltransferase involved in cell wall biosynthesis